MCNRGEAGDAGGLLTDLLSDVGQLVGHHPYEAAQLTTVNPM